MTESLRPTETRLSRQEQEIKNRQKRLLVSAVASLIAHAGILFHDQLVISAENMTILKEFVLKCFPTNLRRLLFPLKGRKK